MKLIVSLMLAVTAVALQNPAKVSLELLPSQLLTMKLLVSLMLAVTAVALQNPAKVS
jgi:hypothetical protein